MSLEPPSPPSVTTDPWRRCAQQAYDAAAAAKSDPRRYARFVAACSRIAQRLGIAGDDYVLDAGCGCGELAAALAGHRRYLGIDVSRGSLEVARRLNPRAALVRADLAAPGVRDGGFDVVVALSALEFCADKAGVLQRLHAALRAGGRLYVEVRSADFLPLRLAGPGRRLLRAAGVLRDYDAPGFRDLSSDEWRGLLSDGGFEILDVLPALRPPGGRGLAAACRGAVIGGVARVAPTRWHYMVGVLCRKP